MRNSDVTQPSKVVITCMNRQQFHFNNVLAEGGKVSQLSFLYTTDGFMLLQKGCLLSWLLFINTLKTPHPTQKLSRRT